MSSLSDPTSRNIGEAALRLFARHGYRRTSMADVAREAGVSRATLYLRFHDKTALFAHLAAQVVDDALAAAEAAWRDDAPLVDNIEATLVAKDLRFYALHASPHGAELMALDAELTRAQAERLNAGFSAMLSRRVMVVEGANLEAFGGADGFGRFLALAGAGLKHEARAEAEYREAVKRLAAVAARAAQAVSAGAA